MAQADVRLDGHVVAITGAGSGLGRAYALAAADAGATILVADIDANAAEATAARIRAAGGRALAVGADIADPDAADRLVDAALQEFGRVDGFVANAGILAPGALLTQDASLVRRMVAVNVEGAIHTVTAAARAMRDGGSIVMIVSGSLLGSEDLALYGTTKAAALGLVYGLAVELRGTGVRITGLAPRARTGMSAQMGSAGEDKGGDPAGVAPVVTYLLSDASRGLNGQVLRFDGERLAVLHPPRIGNEVAGGDWDAASIAAAMSGPLADEARAALPGVARRSGGAPEDVLDVDTAHSSKCLGAEGDE